MPKIELTCSTGAAMDFTALAKERGYQNGKQFLIALAKAELAHWRASNKAGEKERTEMELLEGEII